MWVLSLHFIIGWSRRGAGQDAGPLLSESESAVGAEHCCCLQPLGLLQQKPGEDKLPWGKQEAEKAAAVWLKHAFLPCYHSVAPLQNASFTVPWLGVSGLGTVCKTPLALLEQARSCCSPAPLSSAGHTQLYTSANSFHIFLRVLALCLSQDRAGGVRQRQIKGR